MKDHEIEAQALANLIERKIWKARAEGVAVGIGICVVISFFV